MGKENKKELMEVRCAWCDNLIHMKYHHEPAISHGICRECFRKEHTDYVNNLSSLEIQGQRI